MMTMKNTKITMTRKKLKPWQSKRTIDHINQTELIPSWPRGTPKAWQEGGNQKHDDS
jgi:hypothetical protein